MIRILLKVTSILSYFLPDGLILSIFKGPLKYYLWVIGAAAGEGKGLSIFFNLAEKKQLFDVMQNTHTDDICFDIGANVGLYTLLFSRYGKRVYSFEPSPRNISYLYKNISINKLSNAIIIPCAVSESNGLCFFSEGSNCATGKIDSRGDSPTSVISIDYYIKYTNIIPNIIKIDVEGSELSVLKGGINSISNFRPLIFISIHNDRLRSECLKFIKELDYQIVPIDNDEVEKAWEYKFYPVI